MENKLQNDANEEQISEAAKLQRSPLSGSARDLFGAGSYALSTNWTVSCSSCQQDTEPQLVSMFRPVLCMVACMYESGI